MDSLQIEIAWRVRNGAGGRTGALLARVARHVARGEGFRGGAISIAVVGRRAMATLHLRHMSIDGPTDVLTYDLGTSARRQWIEGEIVACRDVAVREAGRLHTRENSETAIARELALYVAHGVLHLAGYDDHSPTDFRRIHAKENGYLSQLSLGPVFGTIIE